MRDIRKKLFALNISFYYYWVGPKPWNCSIRIETKIHIFQAVSLRPPPAEQDPSTDC